MATNVLPWNAYIFIFNKIQYISQSNNVHFYGTIWSPFQHTNNLQQMTLKTSYGNSFLLNKVEIIMWKTEIAHNEQLTPFP